jgi:LmbE family N-acetylglucosaminyl deacetylase
MKKTHRRLLIVSPHFDDAVFGCGALLSTYPGAAVCTVFAASPEHDMSTEWDAKAGFSSAYASIRARTAEDAAALALLDAVPIRLPFRDGQYRDSPSVGKIASLLGEAICHAAVDTLVMPLGLHHPDHALVYEACCDVLPRLTHLSWFAYEDALHRRMPGVVEARMSDLAARGIVATPARPANGHTLDPERQAQAKRQAVMCYGSQLRAFGPGGYDDVFAPERYWQLSVVHACALTSRWDGSHGRRAQPATRAKNDLP